MKLNKKFYTIKEVAEILSVSRQWVWSLRASGKLKSVKFAYKCVRIPREALEAFIEEKMKNTQEALDKKKET